MGNHPHFDHFMIIYPIFNFLCKQATLFIISRVLSLFGVYVATIRCRKIP